MSSFRYLVHNLTEAVEFYTEMLGFRLEQQFGEIVAIVSRGELRLYLSGPASISSSQTVLNNFRLHPGGSPRIIIEVRQLADLMKRLKSFNVKFTHEIIESPRGQVVLCQDPSGNLIELFESRQSFAEP